MKLNYFSRLYLKLSLMTTPRNFARGSMSFFSFRLTDSRLIIMIKYKSN